jgi:hypothetical protein
MIGADEDIGNRDMAYRKFFDEVVWPDAQAREEDGKRPNQAVFDEMVEQNIIALRLGPGPHLEGRTLLAGSSNPRRYVLSCDTYSVLSCLLSLTTSTN